MSENLFSITQRSLSTLIKNQGINDLYRIYSIARQDGIDFNLANISADFSQSSDQPFDQKYMIALMSVVMRWAAKTSLGPKLRPS